MRPDSAGTSKGTGARRRNPDYSRADFDGFLVNFVSLWCISVVADSKCLPFRLGRSRLFDQSRRASRNAVTASDDRPAGTVGDAPDQSRRVHDQNVEANAIGAPVRMIAQNDFAGADQPGLLPHGQGDARLPPGVGRDFTSTIDRMPAFSATASTSPALVRRRRARMVQPSASGRHRRPPRRQRPLRRRPGPFGAERAWTQDAGYLLIFGERTGDCQRIPCPGRWPPPCHRSVRTRYSLVLRFRVPGTETV